MPVPSLENERQAVIEVSDDLSGFKLPLPMIVLLPD